MPQIRTLPAHSTPPWPLPHLPGIAHTRLARTSVSFGVAGGAALFGVDGSAAVVVAMAVIFSWSKSNSLAWSATCAM